MANETIKELTKMKADLEKKLKSEEAQVKRTVLELEAVNNLISIKRGKEPVDSSNTGILKSDIPSKYDKDMYQEKKVIFALNKMKEASVKQISEFIHSEDKDKNRDIDKVYARVQQIMIKMTKDHTVIKGKGYGAKYRLKIIDN